MRREIDDELVVDIAPFGVVVHLFDHCGRSRHESEGQRETSEFVLTMEGCASKAPSWERCQCGMDVGLVELDGQGPV